MVEVGLGDEWATNATGFDSHAEWKQHVFDIMFHHEQIQWLLRMEQKPKLRTYRKIKHDLTFENYLTKIDKRNERANLCKIRSGTNGLRIETGRHEGLQAEDRICLVCKRGIVEDETHFMLECEAYNRLRKRMWRKIENISKNTITERFCHRKGQLFSLVALLGYNQAESIIEIVNEYVKLALIARTHLLEMDEDYEINRE
jgi:hypothetical protein